MEAQVAAKDLPMTFKVKYIGCEVGRGLWGVRYTKGPVDSLYKAAKNPRPDKVPPICDLTVTLDGVNIETVVPKTNTRFRSYPIGAISYGVQDLEYANVFAMIVVKEDNPNPFEVHAFVCNNGITAKRLTFALDAAFQDYSQRVKAGAEDYAATVQTELVIDLPEKMECEETQT